MAFIDLENYRDSIESVKEDKINTITSYFAEVDNHYVNYLSLGLPNEYRLQDIQTRYFLKDYQKELVKVTHMVNILLQELNKYKEMKEAGLPIDWFKLRQCTIKYNELRSKVFDLNKNISECSNSQKDSITYTENQLDLLKLKHLSVKFIKYQ